MQGIHRIAACVALLVGPCANALFINEIHYDNAGSDVGEGVELAAVSGTNLDGYTLAFYNGSNGQVYRSVTLSGIVKEQDNGYGTLYFGVSGLQNGGPDGIALIDPTNVLVQFLSYEGSFTATDGAASGFTSSDIGLVQDGSGNKGESLQLSGTGLAYADFSWVLAAATYGEVNAAQVFASATVPLPTALPLLLGASMSLLSLRRAPRRRRPVMSQ